MKVYNNQNGKKVKSSTLWYIVLMVGTVALIALCVTLAALNAGKSDVSVPTGGNQESDKVTTKPTVYVLPFEGYTVAREASLDKLVYMPSVNMWKTHNGVDFTPSKEDKVKVMADGVILSAEQSTLEGWIVTVDHGDGLVSYYKSLASSSVKAGDKVKAGDVIGVAGHMLSEADVGKHVHLEVTKNGNLTDPLSYLDTDSIK